MWLLEHISEALNFNSARRDLLEGLFSPFIHLVYFREDEDQALPICVQDFAGYWLGCDMPIWWRFSCTLLVDRYFFPQCACSVGESATVKN